MPDVLPSPLNAWESFYVIVGSSGGALTGLQFVVIALVADLRTPSTRHEISAFGTPTVVHFCAVLLLAAMLSAPWRSLAGTAIALGAGGVAGLVYAMIVVRRAMRQTGYQPVLEDWLWHAVFPLASYGTLVVAAIVLRQHPEPALFAVAASALFLLFIGIHNAWDAVAYIAVERRQKDIPSAGPGG